MILKIAKWITIIFVVGWISLFAFFKIQYMLNPYVPIDEFNGKETDFDDHPDDVGITYVLSEEQINGTKYVIQLAGSRRDNKRGPNWDSYFIQVSKLSHYDVERQHPYFGRYFDANDLPAKFWTNSVNNLYNYNSSLREIYFEIGSSNLICKLPPADAK